MERLAEKLITQPSQLADCLTQMASCRSFGFDTEFVGEDNYHPRLCLIQIATPNNLFLIDPFTVGPLEGFWRILVDPGNRVIVHAGREEVRLCHLWCGQSPSNLFDLQIAAGLVGLNYPLGHGPLVSHVLGIHLSKAETLTEWRNRPLTPSQIRYAFDDVRYLLPVCEHLTDQLKKRNRLEWAQEEFNRLREHATPPEPGTDNDRWRKLRGAGSLDRRKLAVLRELYRWREQTAAAANRPPRTVVRDDLLVQITRRNPKNERDLHVVRGLAKRHAAGIYTAIEQARSLPLERCPVPAEREQDPPQVALVVNILSAVVADFAARHQLAPNLVASSQDLKLLVRCRLSGKPFPDESILARGWRKSHVLPELLPVLRGERGIRIADILSESPFAFFDHSPGPPTSE
jgi:ribonuclease D